MQDLLVKSSFTNINFYKYCNVNKLKAHRFVLRLPPPRWRTAVILNILFFPNFTGWHTPDSKTAYTN